MSKTDRSDAGKSHEAAPGTGPAAPGSAPAQPPAQGRARVEEIEGLIAWAIQTGAIAPGERLREAELATRYDVSRAVIREVLRTLSQEGLVDIEQNRGARVVRLSAQEYSDLMEIHAMFFGLAARLAAVRAGKAQLHEMRIFVDSIGAEVRSGCSPETFYCRRAHFFELVFAMTGSFNAMRNRMSASFSMRWPYALSAIRNREEQLVIVDNWKKLLTMLEQNDSRGAEVVALENVLITKLAGIRAIREGSEP